MEKMGFVATAANNCVDSYCTQLDDAGSVGVYGGENGGFAGWNHVVSWPLVVKIPGGAMSSESHTSNVPLIAP